MTVDEAQPAAVQLWSDEPSIVDMLAFQGIAETLVDALLDDGLDPVALGVSGQWGSGKTTVLRLIEKELKARTSDESKILVVVTDPWRYDPSVGAKESVISEVLDALSTELESRATPGNKALDLAKRLSKRIDWAKAVRLAATTSLTLQLPKVDDLTSLIKDSSQPEDPIRGLERFRDEFRILMKDDELKHVRRVVVLVDDLDRCLPGGVVETLEAIRLFLAVPGMSFVIAADEDRVADAIRAHYPRTDNTADRAAEDVGEEPAKLYLHKIVQTTIPLPALSRFDTEAYLLLLQVLNRRDLEAKQAVTHLVAECTRLRSVAASLDDLRPPDGATITAELTFAARLTPLLYEKLRGNPRRIKRFLNDLSVRHSVATKRGISLELPVIAKLMVLEQLLETEFRLLLEWLADGELHENIMALEAVARGPQQADNDVTGAERDHEEDDKEADGREASQEPGPPIAVVTGLQTQESFSENLIRWAKLPPELASLDLSPYLHLAASVTGTQLLDRDLPERLRDIADNLTSSVRAEQKSVTDDDLRALSVAEVDALVQHLGRRARDRKLEQRAAVLGILRLAAIHTANSPSAVKAIGSIPPGDIEPAVAIDVSGTQLNGIKETLDNWRTHGSILVQRALQTSGTAGGH
jgi:hypothetical protein